MKEKFEKIKLENKKQILSLCAKEVFKRLDTFENKDFRPKTIEDCESELSALIGQKWLSEAWLKSVAEAYINDCPMLITLNKEWIWNFVCGSPGQEEKYFLKQLEESSEIINKGKMNIKNGKASFKLHRKGKWGLNFFNKK